MSLSVRLDAQLARDLENAARVEGISKSVLIRRCLEEYLARRRSAPTPWQLGQDLFGRFGSGRGDLSSKRKQIVRRKIHAKKGRG